MVDSSDAAIVGVTMSVLILLCAKFKVKTIRKQFAHENIKHIAVTGGEPINNVSSTKCKWEMSLIDIIPLTSVLSPETATTTPEPLEILVFTSRDALFLWSNDVQKYLRCYMRHSIPLQKIYWSWKKLVLLLNDGDLYIGHLTIQVIDPNQGHESTEEFIEPKSNRRLNIRELNRCEITLERILNIDRVTDVSVDQRSESFVILQVRRRLRDIFQPYLFTFLDFFGCRKI